MSDVELAALLTLCGLGIGLTTAPVVTASLDAVARSRSGLAAATVNVARELGGVVAVAGLGALVVARLSGDLTARLLDLGVPQGRAGVLVEALLRGATQDEVVDCRPARCPSRRCWCCARPRSSRTSCRSAWRSSARPSSRRERGGLPTGAAARVDQLDDA
jgi:hypothetical protein